MSRDVDTVRAVVVKLVDPGYPTPERAWVACCMSADTYDVIGEEDWQDWKRKALALCLADADQYEQREIELRIPQGQLEALFSHGPIDVQVGRRIPPPDPDAHEKKRIGM